MNAPSDLLAARVQPSGPSVPWQERRAIVYTVLIALAVVLVMRGTLGPTVLHDSLAIYWVWADQFTAELAHGSLYPRWLPSSDAGLGTPVFYFYPPLAFYLTGLFGLLGLSTYASLMAAFAIAFAASGIGCWHWLNGRSNHPLIAASFFAAAPYHLFNYTDRGALAESVAIAFIPLLAIGLRRIAERKGGLLFTALAYAGLIGTHLPLALIASLFFIAPYALVHRQQLLQFAAAAALGIGLAAIYLVPALALEPYHDVAQLYRSGPLTTGYWSIFTGHWDDLTYKVVFLVMGSIVAAATAAAVPRRDGWAAYAIAIVVLVAGAIPLLWSLPLLREVQFPYRALPLAEFALATALARLPRGPGLAAAPFALPVVISLLVLPGFHRTPDDLQFLRTSHPDVYEYLPRGVIKPGQPVERLRDVVAPRIPPPHVPGMIVEPRFYFPSWSCGTEEPRTQLLMHEPSCKPHIVWTWAEKLGAIISLIAGLICLGVRLRLNETKTRLISRSDG